MNKLLRWTLLVVALSIFGLVLYGAKLKHDLDVSLRGEINRRFADAGGQIQVLDVGNPPTQSLPERDRALVGQAAMSEYLLSVRIAGYYSRRGAVPASVEEADSLNPGGQTTPQDPWGKPFRLASENTVRFLIISGGSSGISFLTPQERDTLSNQLAGRTYLLNGKIIFKGDLSIVPIRKQGKSPAAGGP